MTERGTVDAYASVRSPWVYAFGAFRLDPSRGLLTYGSDVVPLPERLFTILLALLKANGAVVSRDDLSNLIWPDGIVGDNNLAQHVYMLRRLLGERAGDRLYIMTVHNKGFRFVAPIGVVESTPPTDSTERGPEGHSTSNELLRPGLRAFRHFTNGSDLLEQGHAKALQQAIDHFAAALSIDSSYLPALVGLARARMLLANEEYCPRDNEFPEAKDAVIRALQIDPKYASAHAVLASITLYSDWSWREAKREIDLAVALAPDSGLVHRSAAYLYEWAGQPEKALVEVQRAIVTEPSSLSLQVLLGRMLARCGDNEGAIAHFSNLIESNPSSIVVRRNRAEMLIVNQQYSDALLDLLVIPNDRAEDLSWRYRFLCLAYAGNGDVDRAREIYDLLVGNAKTEYISNRNMVALALALGDRSTALRYFERAMESREASLPLLRLSPTISAIRGSDVFKSLANVIG